MSKKHKPPAKLNLKINSYKTVIFYLYLSLHIIPKAEDFKRKP